MKLSFVLPLFAQLAFGGTAFAQDDDPILADDPILMDSPDDFKKLEPDVIEAFNWLMNTPVGTDPETRSVLHAFMITWADGTPDITIELRNKIVPYMKQYECLVIFLGGYAVYALDYAGNVEPANAAMFVTERVIEFYKANKGALGTNKDIEKLMKLQADGELTAYIKKHS